jgi:cytochrome c oxidase subunit IV
MNATCHPSLFFVLKRLKPQQQATLIVMVFSFMVWPRKPRQGAMVIVLIFVCVASFKTTMTSYFHFHGFFFLFIL